MRDILFNRILNWMAPLLTVWGDSSVGSFPPPSLDALVDNDGDYIIDNDGNNLVDN